MDVVITFASGLGGAGLGAGIIIAWLQRTLADHAALKQRLQHNIEDRLGGAETATDGLDRACTVLAGRLEAVEHAIEPLNVPLLNQQIQSLARQLDAVEGKLDRYIETTTRLEERLPPQS